MVKLNNKGWGMGNLIAFICIFVVVLIGIAYLAYRYGREQNTTDAVGKKVHEMIEVP